MFQTLWRIEVSEKVRTLPSDTVIARTARRVPYQYRRPNSLPIILGVLQGSEGLGWLEHPLGVMPLWIGAALLGSLSGGSPPPSSAPPALTPLASLLRRLQGNSTTSTSPSPPPPPPPAYTGPIWAVRSGNCVGPVGQSSIASQYRMTTGSPADCVADSDIGGTYGHNERCVVEALVPLAATAVLFNTESGYDILTLGSSCRYSGGAGPTNVAMAAGDTFTWETDVSVTNAGFILCANLDTSTASSGCALAAAASSSIFDINETAGALLLLFLLHIAWLFWRFASSPPCPNSCDACDLSTVGSVKSAGRWVFRALCAPDLLGCGYHPKPCLTDFLMPCADSMCDDITENGAQKFLPLIGTCLKSCCKEKDGSQNCLSLCLPGLYFLFLMALLLGVYLGYTALYLLVFIAILVVQGVRFVALLTCCPNKNEVLAWDGTTMELGSAEEGASFGGVVVEAAEGHKAWPSLLPAAAVSGDAVSLELVSRIQYKHIGLAMSWAESQALAGKMGGRLCTLAEVKAFLSKPTGCAPLPKLEGKDEWVAVWSQPTDETATLSPDGKDWVQVGDLNHAAGTSHVHGLHEYPEDGADLGRVVMWVVPSKLSPMHKLKNLLPMMGGGAGLPPMPSSQMGVEPIVEPVAAEQAKDAAPFSHKDSRLWQIRWENGQTAQAQLADGQLSMHGSMYQLLPTTPISFVWGDGTVQSVESATLGEDGRTTIVWTTTQGAALGKITWTTSEEATAKDDPDTQMDFGAKLDALMAKLHAHAPTKHVSREAASKVLSQHDGDFAVFKAFNHLKIEHPAMRPGGALSVAPTFADSQFKRLYSAATPHGRGVGANYSILELRQTLLKFCQACAKHPTMDVAPADADDFARRLGRQQARLASPSGKKLLRSMSSLESHKALAHFAIVTWTSPMRWRTKGGQGREFCSLINQAIREDGRLSAETLKHAVVICRAINTVLCRSSSAAKEISAWPDGPHASDKHHVSDVANTTFRGGGLPATHLAFYSEGRKFRTSMFMATSFSQAVAKRFMGNRPEPEKTSPVIWIVETEGKGKCHHANLVEKMSMVQGEVEFLFPPYSVFTVEKVERATHTRITLKAAVDNKLEAEDLPTAPWS